MFKSNSSSEYCYALFLSFQLKEREGEDGKDGKGEDSFPIIPILGG